VMNRGHRGGPLYLTDEDRRRFLGAVSELPERFGLEIHAFVLMDNHYHMVVRTQEPNLSHAIRWLNLTYAVKFNWAHRFRGTVFQGRFKAIVIEEERQVCAVARYLHLNPVRVTGLGLSKKDQRQAKVIGCEDPGNELIQRRLKQLAEYAWSSWRVYAGAETGPGWLETGVIARLCGGRSHIERRKALRAYTEDPIRQGRMDNPWEGLIGGAVLGGAEFAQRVLSGQKIHVEEQTGARQLRRKVSWEAVVKAAERIRGSKWEDWWERHGDWGREAVMHVAVRHGGMRLAEVVRACKGIRYQAAAQAVKRFATSLKNDPARRLFVTELKRHVSTI
jgi:putative transposase